MSFISPSPREASWGLPNAGAGASVQPPFIGSGREAIGGVSQVWTRYEGRQGWSRARDSRCCRTLARIPPPAEMQQGRPSLCCVSTIRSSQGPPEPGEGGLQGMAGVFRPQPGGLRGRQGWGEMLRVHPRLVGTASGSAERGAEGMEGGWVLVVSLWLLPCRAREGEESPWRRPPPCPRGEPAQGLPGRGVPLTPILPLLRNAPVCPGSAPPLPLPGSNATRQRESWDPRAGPGEQEAAEELLEELAGALGSGAAAACPRRERCRRHSQPCLSSCLVFPFVFPPCSPICSRFGSLASSPVCWRSVDAHVLLLVADAL